jgi:DNA-directed RNA polymerase subunit RPC12/RpoP
MARVDYPIEPTDIANTRENGMRSLDIQCHRCPHKVLLEARGGLRRPRNSR